MIKKNLSPLDKNKDLEKYEFDHQYLFDDQEYLSDKLKKYKKVSAKSDLENEKNISNPFIHSLAMARLSFNNSIVVYKLNNDVIDTICNTNIGKLPDEIPSIFDKPFIIETHDEKTTLFGDVNSIMCTEFTIPDYARPFTGNNEKTCKQIIFHADTDRTSLQLLEDIQNYSMKEGIGFSYLGFNVFEWTPNLKKTNWKFNRRDYNRKTIDTVEFCGKCDDAKYCNEKANDRNKNKNFICFDGIFDNFISFLTVFSYMLDAENTPIQYKNSIERLKYAKTDNRKKIVIKNEDWIIKYLRIDKDKIRYKKNGTTTNLLDKEGLIKKDVKVRSHFRFQACGENYSKHRLIKIESFTSSKWVKDNDIKVIVSI